MSDNIKWFNEIGIDQITEVGGKNASLGEMTNQLAQLGINIPFGFATTAHAFREFTHQHGLADKISAALATLDVGDVKKLAETGKQIRQWVMDTPFLPEFEQDVIAAWEKLSNHHPDFAVAVRSSATAEDLANASFAGQQESYLNIRGQKQVIHAIKQVFASLFNDRAIAYRVHNKFAHDDVAISVGVQQMVRSDLAASGVLFTMDTESGFDQVVFITSSYGLGEAIVQGSVNPDEFYVHKPTLAKNKLAILRRNLGTKLHKLVYAPAGSDTFITSEPVPLNDQRRFSLNDDEVTQLASYAVIIEKHYQKPMDIEWGKDGVTGELFILQARPETVNSQKAGQTQKQFMLKQRGTIKSEGRSVGQGIGQGQACIIHDTSEMDRMQKGFVLVTEMTDPDWEPIMSRASAIVTNRGGRTCHAAIIARELGIPAVVGCGDATETINDGESITVSCAEGETGYIYDGLLKYDVKENALTTLPALPIKIMLNVGNPDRAFGLHNVPNAGVGLARLEFIINQMAGIHPRALIDFDKLTDSALKDNILARTSCYTNPVEYYIEKIREGMATIAATFYPKPVIFRLSDFKSNEYANLIGGDLFEPHEENPMIGFRGASRYVSPSFQDCFALECQAVKRVRDDMGLDNLQIMIPFVRTLDEAKAVNAVLAKNGLRRGEHGLKVMMMCEIPSNAVLAEQFLEYFDGFSIGSNDMTQLTLGMDRDSSMLGAAFDERDPAVKYMLSLAIAACRKAKKYIGICGQGPSDYPDFAEWLMKEGIETISLNPDSVLQTIERLSP